MDRNDETTEFLKDYKEGEELEAPRIYRSNKYIDLQFNGWSITLIPEHGTYFLNDTTGG